ncbi:unnamed protein product [Brachionus calyciflorus]|uniref:Uncharacterized protein n=1 Tax=Brachionus calyciflorus TaxID=104777 RepID=A0A814NXL3_9BILA|nr:unnamed protein product [Brachionus calyciflorus]
MFTTVSNLKNLENAHIFVDGTFDIAPKLFKQVYNAHALVNGRCLTMVYGLMTRKNEEMYKLFHYKQSMWRKIVDLGLKIDYNEDEKIRQFLKIPQALAFIPPEDVVTGFELIKSKQMLSKHPLVYSLEDSFIKEQKRVEFEMIKLKTGIVYKRRQKYQLLDERIQIILSNYSKENIEETLINLSLFMKY